MKIINAIANFIVHIKDKVESLPQKIPETIVILSYCILHLLMALVHEPWYDEAVAWQIARSAPISRILFEIPHYEGHPQLWHLILLPFAKLGVSYELSLSLVSLIFAGTAIFLILWFAPFPRIVKLLLPFTYFFFYQYGVISRPYCIMMLSFILLAICHKNRNEQPGKYVLSLMLLCGSSAYGIVFAGGLSIVWLIEIIRTDGFFSCIKNYTHDRRLWWLTLLLVWALFLIISIVPRHDTYATNPLIETEDATGWLKRIVYLLIALPSDVTITSAFCDYAYLKDACIINSSLISACIAGIIIWISIIYFGKQKHTLLLFTLPYVMFCLFSSTVYFFLHHTGICLLYMVYWFWVTLDTPSSPPAYTFKNLSPELTRTIHSSIVIFSTLLMSVSLYWNISACVLDIFKTYSMGRYEAEFIKEHNLDNYNIMVQWTRVYNPENGEMVTDINHCAYANCIAPYFEHNIFYNFMFGSDDRNYTSHKLVSEEETIATINAWKEYGYPDILYMQPVINSVFSIDEITYNDYALVYCQPIGKVWKNTSGYHLSRIYVRRDLLETLNLEELQ